MQDLNAFQRARYRQEKARTVRYLEGAGGQPMFLTLEDFYEGYANGVELLQPRVVMSLQPSMSQHTEVGYLYFPEIEFSTSFTGSIPAHSLLDQPDPELS